MERGLIDKFYKYEPNFFYDKDANIHFTNGMKNEVEKRNIGLRLCEINKCKYFMTMDCDEFYDTKQLKDCYNDFVKNDYDSSYCQMKTYYKYPTLEITPHENYYVPLFYKIKKDNNFDLKNRGKNYPVIADPTRCLKAGYVFIYDRESIEMYHYSYVRNDIKSKVLNSSSQFGIKNQSKVIDYHNNFRLIDRKALFIGDENHRELKLVENKFKIQI